MIVYAWTLTATLGALFALWGTWDAWRDRAALGPVTNGRRILANGWVRREVIRFAIQSVWAVIGIASLGIASAEADVLDVLFLLTAVGLAANTALDVRERRSLRYLVESEGPDPVP